MRSYKAVCVAVMMGIGMAGMTMPVAQAATPLEQCNKATGKLFNSLLKTLGGVIQKACSGKALAELAPKAADKLNKAVDKAKSVDEKVDCVANGDPDGTSIWSTPAFDAADVESSVGSILIQCNGVDD